MTALPDLPPQMQPDGSVIISPQQLDLHRTTEGLSLFLGAPLLLWAATRDRPLTTHEKLGLGILGIGAILVDGYLLFRFRAAELGPEEDEQWT